MFEDENEDGNNILFFVPRKKVVHLNKIDTNMTHTQ